MSAKPVDPEEDEMTQIRLGVAQPRTWYGAEERRNLDEAVDLIRQAGAINCDLLLFPENFPGPYRERGRFDAIGPLSAAARENKVAVVAGTSEETEPGSNRFHIIAVVIGAVVYTTLSASASRYRCEVCMEFQGRKACRTASAATEMQARQTSLMRVVKLPRFLLRSPKSASRYIRVMKARAGLKKR